MDQNFDASAHRFYLLSLLFIPFVLLCPLVGRAQPTSSVTIDDVVVDDVGLHVYVSNSEPDLADATLFASTFNGTTWGHERTVPVKIPALCNNLKLDVIPVRFPPGGYDLRIQLSLPGQGVVDSFYTSHVSYLSHYPNSLFSGSHPQHGVAMDPVNTLTGELILAEKPDFFLDGPIPLIFQRYSASSSLPHESAPPALGVHWRHNFDAAAFRIDDTVRVMLASGRPVDFVLDGDVWRRISPHEHDVQLISLSDTLLYGDPSDPYLYYFDPGGLLAAVEDAAGNRLTLSYSGRSLDRVEDGLGHALHFTYDTIGRLASVSDGTREVSFETMTFSKNIGENLRRMTDPLGGKTTYFNATVPDVHRQLLLSRYTPRGNRPWTQAYDSLGRVTKQTDALGNEHRFIYLDDPALTLMINPDGDTVLHEHDGRIEPGSEPRKLVEVRDQEGESTRFGYDEGRLTSIVNRLGDSVAFEHDERGLLTTYRDPEGHTSAYRYEVRSMHGIQRPLLTAEELPDGTAQRWEYDAVGNPVAYVDRAGNRFLYEYNDRGLLLSETLPTGGVIRYGYDEKMNLISMTDPAGNTTTFTRDNLGRLTGATLADGATLSIELDPLDRITAITDPEGNRREISYDANGNVIATVDPDGGERLARYDLMERIDTAVDRRGGTSTFDFTPYGELQQMALPDGGTIAWEYDRRGLAAALVDNGGRRFLREHDAEGRVVRSADPLGDAVAYEYDRRGFLTAVTSPEGNRFSIERDAMGRATRIVAPSGRSTSIEYGGNGQPQRVATGEGVAGEYERNGLGQITAIVDPNGERWENGYDQGGRMTSRRDPLGRTTQLTYDLRNRVDSIILPEGMGEKVITYDRNGRVIAERWSDGTAVDYDRDVLGRVVESAGVSLGYDAEGDVISSNGVTIERDVMGRPIAMTFAVGRRVEYDYNADGTLQSVRDWNGNEITFDYDAEGKLTEIGRPNGVATTWTYDRDNQWSAIAHGSIATMEFERDADGRIIAAERELPLEPEILPSIRSFGYDGASQRTGVDHDAMGRVVREGERTFSWDLASRLTSLQRPEGTASMTWNADGFLTGISDGSVDRELVWNYGLGIPSTSVERRAGADHTYYLHTPGGRLLARIDASSGAIQYYHFSETGSTLFLTDADGSVVGSWAYLPYGANAGGGGGGENLFTWGGEYGTITLGGDLYNMRARWYDASVGRFLSPDPVHSILPMEINPYQYVEGDPMQMVDIDGRSGTNWEAEIARLEAEAAAQQKLDQWKQDVIDPLNELEQKILDEAVASAERRANENRERMAREQERREALAKKQAEDRRKQEEADQRWNDKMEDKVANELEEIDALVDRITESATRSQARTPAPSASPGSSQAPAPVSPQPTPPTGSTGPGSAVAPGSGAAGTGGGTAPSGAKPPPAPPKVPPGAPRGGNRANGRQIDQASVVWAFIDGFFSYYAEFFSD